MTASTTQTADAADIYTRRESEVRQGHRNLSQRHASECRFYITVNNDKWNAKGRGLGEHEAQQTMDV